MSETVSPSPLSPVSLLARSARVFAPRTAVIDGEREYTYEELGERVGRAAAVLRGLGVGPGDRVAYLCPNLPAMLEGHFAVPLLGAVLVAINTRLAPQEIAYILDHCGAKVLVAETGLAESLSPLLAQREALAKVVAVRDGGSELVGAVDYEEALARVEPLPLDSPCDDEAQMLAINYTSGTTGFPKGVVYTHRGAFLNALALAVQFRLDSSSVYLWTLPMFHCNGWCFPWAVTAVGGTHVCLRKIDASEVATAIRQRAVSHLCGAPTVLILLANDRDFCSLQLTHKLTVGTGGAPPSPTIIRAIEGLGAEIVHIYGLTETYGPFTICEWLPDWNARGDEQRARLKARQGVPHVTAGELRVVTPEMQDVPRDGETLGEIVMRGNSVMAGYYENPTTAAEAFRGGWFHSGDLAVWHEDGYIEIRDRGKDIIISGGENISTVEVERILYEHPAVLEVAVIGVPDPKWGEVPKAFVVLKPGQNATEQELIDFCRARMAHFKCPKTVAFAALPKTSTGKIQKFVLRDQEWSGRSKRVN
jgi:acyl-CoA synthetase (AMP-forming)/AMP-acid ligase II